MKKWYLYFYTLLFIGIYTGNLQGIRCDVDKLCKAQEQDTKQTRQTKLLIASIETNNQKLAESVACYAKATAIAIPIPKEIEDFITGVSFKTDGPITIDELVYVVIVHYGFDNKLHLGEMIVNKKYADDVVAIFTELYHEKYPIEKIRLIDEYGADDDKSMEDNNASALCVRKMTGKNKYSKHSFGIAIDINPLQNPYVKTTDEKIIVLPKISAEYIDRTNVKKGMIIKGDACYNAFVKRGWKWGGECWLEQYNTADYQHFEKDLD